jgi:Family of unknown function (DUF5677)
MAKKRELKNIYRSLKPYVKEVTHSTLINPDFFQISLRAAFAKIYDFNSFVSSLSSSSHSFYHTATLRGICEDLIVLKAIKDIPGQDRSNLVMYLQLNEMYETMRTQGRFFKNNHHQIVLDEKFADKRSDDEFTKAMDIYKQHGFQIGKYGPSVKSLAKRANLSDLYDFFYAATSAWVHFSPHILLRMGWGAAPEASTTFTFTTKHFSAYYRNFNAIYGTYLFVLFCETFQSNLSLNSKTKKYLEELQEYINAILRWPELLTFEEMNLEAPNLIVQAIYSVTEGYTKRIEEDDVDNSN